MDQSIATAQAPLAARFAATRDWFASRASTVFPLRLRTGGDTLIVFLDYWRIKNRLDTVSCFLRVYDAEGRVVARTAQPIAGPHTELSMARLLGRDDFDGMVEVEFVGGQNLTFNYPAVVAFYRSGSLYSAVHASGRIRNADEARVPSRSLETNWTCKLRPGVVPFFHVFNGPRAGALADITVRIHGSDGRVIDQAAPDLGLQAPFASRVVAIDSLFDLARVQEGEFFVSVELPDDDCFPRLVVGNLHRGAEFLETTHSFYWSQVEDPLARDEAGHPQLLSFIPAMNVPELELELGFFPTNTDARVKARVRSARAGEALRDSGRSATWQAGGAGSGLWKCALDEETALLCFDLEEEGTPARLNTAYRYRVRGAAAAYSTDIATGAHAFVYPAKFSHWGHGIVSDEFETVLMIRNISHDRRMSRPATGTLSVFDAGTDPARTTVTVPSEGCTFVRLRDLARGGAVARTISWFLRSDCPDLEAFWISYSAAGAICGEHAF